MQNNQRYAALDLVRFTAALIVFFGHMVFLPDSLILTDHELMFLSPTETGATVVLFFFALSGFVLTINSNYTSYFDWTRRRLFRLYPVYISAWFIGLILVAAHDRHLLNLKVLVLGLLGFQTLSPKATMVINAPLWSLSIEIICALFLFYLIKLRKYPVYLFMLLGCSTIFWLQHKSWPIIETIPYFIIGILIRNEKFERLNLNRKFIKLISIIGIFFTWRLEHAKLRNFQTSL